MLQLGNWNELEVTRFTEHGAYLDAGEVGEILMPRNYVTRNLTVGMTVRVFVYLDQQERLVATTEEPLATVGDFAFLPVAWTNRHGAFLHWGLMKDLFVPFREQKRGMENGRHYLVYIYIDEETRRIAASAKVEKWLRPATPADYWRGKEVQILVQQKTPLGFKAIVDNAYSGLIYDNQIHQPPHAGDRLTAYVVNLRADGKLDLSLQRIGKGRFRDFAEELYARLLENNGRLPFSDATPPDEIGERFGVSKKTFKRAVGALYRARKIELHEGEIRLPRQGES